MRNVIALVRWVELLIEAAEQCAQAGNKIVVHETLGNFQAPDATRKRPILLDPPYAVIIGYRNKRHWRKSMSTKPKHSIMETSILYFFSKNTQ